ncbi:hypothetical protein Q4519_13815 [Motilimonas sp. 1_MG-2023]|uniref:hypothetical protein n=1 Tax=Motilimonas sp. 1_MG-2023 TaxID=3062672 RepID=UPI0026E118A2|nr:hypothetical protein [Motilimonas sp. 1_MG-2023]MDO6526762.1 hypothetical protein [Motilimonas sp. 1_MG-2023]
MPILIPLVFELLARPFAGDTTGNGETFTDTLLDCLADAYKGLFLVTPNSFWGKSVLHIHVSTSLDNNELTPAA